MPDPQLFDDPTIRKPEKPAVTCTPDRVGSGPPNETCGTCKYRTQYHWHDRRYYKCALMGKHWTHGKGSDIKLKWAACRSWLPRNLESRVLALGDYAERCIEDRGWFREPLLVIADFYDDQDMGWLRFAAAQMPSMPTK